MFPMLIEMAGDGRRAPCLFYSERDSRVANATWHANCGPHSIAAALGLSLEQTRPHLAAFKGWMTPTALGESLRSLRAGYVLRKGLQTRALCRGINRVQWEGSWLNPGVPLAAAYAHTHWVAHVDGWVLCTATDPAAWVPRDVWEAGLVQEQKPWHVTHHYRIQYAAADV